MQADLAIKGKFVLTMNETFDIIKDGMVVIENNIIKEIGKINEIEKKYKIKKIIDEGCSIIMPGLINTHTHAAMVYFRGLADDLPLSDWLEKHIWPAEAKYVNSEFVQNASQLAILEMIKSGTTCFNDMYFFEEKVAQVTGKAGIRAIIGEAILDFPTPSCKTSTESLAKTTELAKKCQDNELIKVAIAPHSIYTCKKEVFEEVINISKNFNLPIHIHLSETKKEVEDCVKINKKTPIAYLKDLGIFDYKVIAAHAVWLDDNDLEIIKNYKVKISHNPISNMKLASGIAPIAKMLDRKIIIGLGTDGAASNNTLDLFQEMRTTALIHKVNNLDPTLLPAREVVKMATINGAKVLGLDNQIGSLEVGKRADIISIDLNKPHLAPIYNPYSHLVYAASGQDVSNVIINGKIVMQNREVQTLDEEKIISEAQKFVL